MKNNLLKYYTAVIYLCATIVVFAQPGSNSDSGGLEGNDVAASIDDFVLVLAIIGFVLVYLKMRKCSKQTNTL